MRDNSAAAFDAQPKLRIEKLPFDRVPHQSRLFLEYLRNPRALPEFYPAAVEKIEDLTARVPAVLQNYKTDRSRLADALANANRAWQASKQTLENIERLRQNDAVVVVAEQQAKLFTGALDTVYKAFSIIKATEKLRARGVNAVPVFWIASEDHDFAEVAATFVLNRENAVAKIEIENDAANKNLPVGNILLDASIETAIENLFAALPKTEFSPDLRRLIAETYQPNRSLSDTFACLLARLFGKRGLVLLDPLDAELKRLAAPVYAQAIERSAKITTALLEQNDKLETRGFQRQIKVEPNSFPLFWLDDAGEHTALNGENNRVKAKKENVEFAIGDLAQIARDEPERFSPNATLRAAVQDFLLPTVCCFGGAAEIAHFAQTTAVYPVLNKPTAPIFHRASVTIVEPNVGRTLKRYNLTLADFFAAPEELTARIASEFLSSETAQIFAETEKRFAAQLDVLDQNLAAVDRTLSESLTKRKQKILRHLDALRRKFYESELRRRETAQKRLAAAFANLYPRSDLQERTLNVAGLLNRHGANVLDWLYAAIDVDAKEHQVLYL